MQTLSLYERTKDQRKKTLKESKPFLLNFYCVRYRDAYTKLEYRRKIGFENFFNSKPKQKDSRARIGSERFEPHLALTNT